MRHRPGRRHRAKRPSGGGSESPIGFSDPNDHGSRDESRMRLRAAAVFRVPRASRAPPPLSPPDNFLPTSTARRGRRLRPAGSGKADRDRPGARPGIPSHRDRSRWRVRPGRVSVSQFGPDPTATAPGRRRLERDPGWLARCGAHASPYIGRPLHGGDPPVSRQARPRSVRRRSCPPVGLA